MLRMRYGVLFKLNDSIAFKAYQLVVGLTRTIETLSIKWSCCKPCWWRLIMTDLSQNLYTFLNSRVSALLMWIWNMHGSNTIYQAVLFTLKTELIKLCSWYRYIGIPILQRKWTRNHTPFLNTRTSSRHISVTIINKLYLLITHGLMVIATGLVLDIQGTVVDTELSVHWIYRHIYGPIQFVNAQGYLEMC